jgi:ribosomal protein L37AE/L43A
MAWNVIPSTKQEASNCVVPVSAIYTPNKPFPNMPVLPYSALRCRTCRSVLNPFSIVDFAAKIWICPFCFQRNHFSPAYSSISDDNLPAELFPHRSVLNPFSIVDFAAKIWICPFCFQRNHFPPAYSSISDDNLPAELFPQYTTIEYDQTPSPS